jgi:hypothetical protein
MADGWKPGAVTRDRRNGMKQRKMAGELFFVKRQIEKPK